MLREQKRLGIFRSLVTGSGVQAFRHREGMTSGGTALEELDRFTFGCKRLGGRLFFNLYEFIAEPVGLTFESLLESLLTLCIALGPQRRVVFDLILHHGEKDDSDFMGGGSDRLPRSDFAPHAAEVVAHRRLVMV